MQLKMYWRVEPVKFPEFFRDISYRQYDGSTEDRAGWLELCKNGLVADDASDAELEFERRYNSRPAFQNDDLYLVFDGGRYVATICGIYEPETNLGYVHMVSVHTDARGHGLGAYVNQIAQAHLSRDPCEWAYLTTDEWRVPAIKSYLRAGFLPVEYGGGEGDMERRWTEWLAEHGYTNIPFLDEKGNVINTIFR
ncbi:MAG: GNAT family N-acetyltransferase [Oscillospiraceae bacterium]|nr:GNAT family N-acetyltransferase [Oscillospiraceae bacterium]